MKSVHWTLRSALALGLLGLGACTTFHNVEPIYPKVAAPKKKPASVESLQPTLKWKPAAGAESYDLIVYQPQTMKTFGEDKERTHLVKVYYRERLTETEHQLETPLLPKSTYYWSVRTRKGEEVSEWSRYDWHLIMVLYNQWATERLFSFRTPSK
jgi:hypothetical protein